jgi:L-ribulose-5-phosphate 3-epimerase UlaE
MSGSSLDGLDLCYSKISSKDENYNFEIIASETIPYDNDVYEKLKKVREISSLDLHFFDIELGKLFGAYCNSFIAKNNIKQIHLKDKNINNKNVLIGEGMVDFESIFIALKKIKYKESFAIESQRGKDIEFQATKNFIFFKKLIKQYINK